MNEGATGRMIASLRGLELFKKYLLGSHDAAAQLLIIMIIMMMRRMRMDLHY